MFSDRAVMGPSFELGKIKQQKERNGLLFSNAVPKMQCYEKPLPFIQLRVVNLCAILIIYIFL